MGEVKEGLIPLLSPVSRGQHPLFYSVQLTWLLLFSTRVDSVMIAGKERVFLRAFFKVDSHIRFRDNRWDSS